MQPTTEPGEFGHTAFLVCSIATFEEQLFSCETNIETSHDHLFDIYAYVQSVLSAVAPAKVRPRVARKAVPGKASAVFRARTSNTRGTRGGRRVQPCLDPPPQMNAVSVFESCDASFQQMGKSAFCDFCVTEKNCSTFSLRLSSREVGANKSLM